MLGDISYHKATLQSEGKRSIHIHIHKVTAFVLCHRISKESTIVYLFVHTMLWLILKN